MSTEQTDHDGSYEDWKSRRSDPLSDHDAFQEWRDKYVSDLSDTDSRAAWDDARSYDATDNKHLRELLRGVLMADDETPEGCKAIREAVVALGAKE